MRPGPGELAQVFGFVAALMVAVFILVWWVRTRVTGLNGRRTGLALSLSWAVLVVGCFIWFHLASLTTGETSFIVTAPDQHVVRQYDPQGRLRREIGRRGSGIGEFQRPSGAATDPDGNIFVADTGNDRVQIFDGSGAYQGEWGGVLRPIAIAVARPLGDASRGMEVFVVEQGSDRARKFNVLGEPTLTFGGAGEGRLRDPRGIAVDAGGAVFVADHGNRRVVQFRHDGAFVKEWAFADPVAVAADVRGWLYVAEPSRGVVTRLDRSTGERTEWPGFSSPTSLVTLSVVAGGTATEEILVADSGSGDVVRLLHTSDTVKSSSPSPGAAAVTLDRDNVVQAYLGWRNLRRSFTALLWLVGALAAMLALGGRLARLGRLAFASWSEAWVFRFALGSLAYIAVGTLLAAVGGLYVSVAVAVIAALTLWSWPDLRDLGRETVRAARSLGEQRYSALAVGCLLVLAIQIAINLLRGALAPTSEPDAMMYHFAAAKIWLQHHGFVYIPWNLQTNLPLGMDMLYTLALLLRDDIFAKLLHFAFGLFTTLAIFAFGRRYLSARVGALAAAIFYVVDVVSLQSGWGYVDLALTFFIFAALLALARWFEGRERNWFVLSALLMGGAFSVKYQAAVALAPVLLALVINAIWKERRGLGIALRQVAGYGLLTMLVASPWFIKNAIFTGNPIYPFLYSVFGGRDLTAERLHNFLAFTVTGVGMGRGPIATLLLPWNVTVYGLQGQWVYFDGVITPLFLALIPLLVWLRRPPARASNALVAFGLIFMGLWALSSQQVRFLLPAFPAFALAAAYAAVRVSEESRPAAVILGALIGVTMLFNQTWMVGEMARRDPVPSILGTTPPEQYLSRRVDCYDAFRYINATLPKSAKIFFLWEERGYYCDREYLADGVPESYYMVDFVRRAGSAEGLERALRAQGITHVLVNRNLETWFVFTSAARTLGPSGEYPRLQERMREVNAILDVFERRWLDQVYTNHEVDVYALRAAPREETR